MNKEEKEIVEIPHRFICVQLKNSEMVTVIDVCAFLGRANDNNAESKLDYADALLATAKPFKNMDEAKAYIDRTETLDSRAPLYSGTKHIVCEEGEKCSFLIRSVNRVTDNYSVHEIESASFVVEAGGKDRCALPLFLYFEKLGNLLKVSKEEIDNQIKEYAFNFNKLPLLDTENLKEELYHKLTLPKKEISKPQAAEGEQEIDR